MNTKNIAPLIEQTHLYLDPLLPVIPPIDGLQCADHATFIVTKAHEQTFIDYWAARGLHPLKPYVTRDYPARHIALVEQPGHTQACEQMIGLSVSDDAHSPINKAIKLHGEYRFNEHGELMVGKLQHLAYHVAPHYDFAMMRSTLIAQGVKFMTPILTFSDKNGAFLKQMFVACTVPYGPFIEIIQRGVGKSGETFQGFNAAQIDVLYGYYEEYSRNYLVC